jgi:hypothetical protein
MYGMRKLEIVLARRIDVDLSGTNLIPPTLRDLNCGRSGIQALPSDGSWVEQMDRIRIGGNGEGNINRALSIRSGVPQYQILWDDVYTRRASLKRSGGDPALDLNIHQTTDDGPGTNTELICTATNADDLWKMVGYRGYKGDAVLDNVQSLSLSNLIQFGVTRQSSSQFTFAWSLSDKTTQNDPNVNNRQEFVYNDSDPDNVPEAWVRDGTSQAWLPILAADEQIRLPGPSQDVLVEVDSVSYDPSTNTMTVNTKTSSLSHTGSTSSIPTGIDRMTYAFFFTSTL